MLVERSSLCSEVFHRFDRSPVGGGGRVSSGSCSVRPGKSRVVLLSFCSVVLAAFTCSFWVPRCTEGVSGLFLLLTGGGFWSRDVLQRTETEVYELNLDSRQLLACQRRVLRFIFSPRR